MDNFDREFLHNIDRSKHLYDIGNKPIDNTRDYRNNHSNCHEINFHQNDDQLRFFHETQSYLCSLTIDQNTEFSLSDLEEGDLV